MNTKIIDLWFIDFNDFECECIGGVYNIRVWNVDGLAKPDPNTLFSTYSDNDINKFIAEDLLRIKRNKLLTESDFKAISDYIHPSEEVKQAWVTYRQALRDVTKTYKSLDTVKWPTAPSE